MSTNIKDAKLGDKVTTDFSGRTTHHIITAIDKPTRSQSGVMFSVAPRIPKSVGGWLDAGWFKFYAKETA